MSKAYTCNNDTCSSCKPKQEQMVEKLKLECKITTDEIIDNCYQKLNVCNKKNEYRIDFRLKNKKIVKICGIVRDMNNKAVEGEIVTLYKEVYRGYSVEKVEIGTGITDCMGMVIFIKECSEESVSYKLSLSAEKV